MNNSLHRKSFLCLIIRIINDFTMFSAKFKLDQYSSSCFLQNAIDTVDYENCG